MIPAMTLVSASDPGAVLFPEVLDEYITQENSVRVIDVFVDGVDLVNMDFKRRDCGLGGG